MATKRWFAYTYIGIVMIRGVDKWAEAAGSEWKEFGALSCCMKAGSYDSIMYGKGAIIVQDDIPTVEQVKKELGL